MVATTMARQYPDAGDKIDDEVTGTGNYPYAILTIL
jgi:hypothetical protein